MSKWGLEITISDIWRTHIFNTLCGWVKSLCPGYVYEAANVIKWEVPLTYDLDSSKYKYHKEASATPWLPHLTT